jgi:hypothetical protein
MPLFEKQRPAFNVCSTAFGNHQKRLTFDGSQKRLQKRLTVLWSSEMLTQYPPV